MKRFAVIASALLFVGSLAAAMLELAPAAIDLRGPGRGAFYRQRRQPSGDGGAAQLPRLRHIARNRRAAPGLAGDTRRCRRARCNAPGTGPSGAADPGAAGHPADDRRCRLFAVVWRFRPGGAFQAGAVLAAAGVLLHLAGLLPGWQTPRLRLRLGLAGGFALFLAVAGGLLAQGTLPSIRQRWPAA